MAAHLAESGYAVHLVCAETVASARAAETMTVEEILDARMVSDPLTQFMLCSPGEGAAVDGPKR